MLVGPQEPFDPVPPAVIRRLEEDPRAHLIGENWDTPPLYDATDVLVLPTYREGFPNVPLEAAAMSLPVVATRIARCIDAVQDRVTGTLVPPRDSVSLATAICRYLSGPALRALTLIVARPLLIGIAALVRLTMGWLRRTSLDELPELWNVLRAR